MLKQRKCACRVATLGRWLPVAILFNGRPLFAVKQLFDFSIPKMLYAGHFYAFYSNLKSSDQSNNLPKTIVSNDLAIYTGFPIHK